MIMFLYVLDTGGVITNFGAAGGVTLMTFLYGIAGTMFAYLFTFTFKGPYLYDVRIGWGKGVGSPKSR